MFFPSIIVDVNIFIVSRADDRIYSRFRTRETGGGVGFHARYNIIIIVPSFRIHPRDIKIKNKIMT